MNITNITSILSVIDKLTIPTTLIIILGFVNQPNIYWIGAGILLYSYMQVRVLFR